MNLNLIAPYNISAVWLHNIMMGRKMQNLYGTTEAVNVNNTENACVLTWDAKITSLLGLMGGVGNINALFMKMETRDK